LRWQIQEVSMHPAFALWMWMMMAPHFAKQMLPTGF
jgi:hypothetical protein